VDLANRVNKCFPSFNPLNLEFSPGLKVIDNFFDHISYNLFNKEKNDKSLVQLLDEMVLKSSLSSSVAIIASDASIKNNVAMSIAHIHTHDKPLIKTIHHAVNITSMEAELFAIRCSINQAMHINNISKIIIITDSIYAVKRIFNLSVHHFQVQSAAILSDLYYFFNCHTNNSIEFGNALAISSGIFIMRLIKKLKCSNHYLSTHIKIHGTSVRSAKAMIF